jgi:hypothetical protein
MVGEGGEEERLLAAGGDFDVEIGLVTGVEMGADEGGEKILPELGGSNSKIIQASSRRVPGSKTGNSRRRDSGARRGGLRRSWRRSSRDSRRGCQAGGQGGEVAPDGGSRRARESESFSGVAMAMRAKSEGPGARRCQRWKAAA